MESLILLINILVCLIFQTISFGSASKKQEKYPRDKLNLMLRQLYKTQNEESNKAQDTFSTVAIEEPQRNGTVIPISFKITKRQQINFGIFPHPKKSNSSEKRDSVKQVRSAAGAELKRDLSKNTSQTTLNSSKLYKFLPEEPDNYHNGSLLLGGTKDPERRVLLMEYQALEIEVKYFLAFLKNILKASKAGLSLDEVLGTKPKKEETFYSYLRDHPEAVYVFVAACIISIFILCLAAFLLLFLSQVYKKRSRIVENGSVADSKAKLSLCPRCTKERISLQEQTTVQGLTPQGEFAVEGLTPQEQIAVEAITQHEQSTDKAEMQIPLKDLIRSVRSFEENLPVYKAETSTHLMDKIFDFDEYTSPEY